MAPAHEVRDFSIEGFDKKRAGPGGFFARRGSMIRIEEVQQGQPNRMTTIRDPRMSPVLLNGIAPGKRRASTPAGR